MGFAIWVGICRDSYVYIVDESSDRISAIGRCCQSCHTHHKSKMITNEWEWHSLNSAKIDPPAHSNVISQNQIEIFLCLDKVVLQTIYPSRDTKYHLILTLKQQAILTKQWNLRWPLFWHHVIRFHDSYSKQLQSFKMNMTQCMNVIF